MTDNTQVTKEDAAAAATLAVAATAPNLAGIPAMGMATGGDGTPMSSRELRRIGITALGFVVVVAIAIGAFVFHQRGVDQKEFAFWQSHAGQTVTITDVTGQDKKREVTLTFSDNTTRRVAPSGMHMFFWKDIKVGEIRTISVDPTFSSKQKTATYDSYTVRIEPADKN